MITISYGCIPLEVYKDTRRQTSVERIQLQTSLPNVGYFTASRHIAQCDINFFKHMHNNTFWDLCLCMIYGEKTMSNNS